MNYRNTHLFSHIRSGLTLGLLVLGLFRCSPRETPKDAKCINGFAGSRSCKECHERFYNLWSPSHHGKAMQPMDDVIAEGILELPPGPSMVGNRWYEIGIEAGELMMLEKATQSSNTIIERYSAKWALGGRNIFYFLTEFEGGRLQTMPLAYDINRKEWYSNPGSAVRHFVDNNTQDEEIDWKQMSCSN